MKKTKLSAAIAMSLLIILMIAGTALADHIDFVTYTDTGEVAAGDLDEDYWFAPDEVGTGSLIRNGDFSNWTDGRPDNWTVWADTADGWENAHVAMTDLALTDDGDNYGLSFFIRNTGGSGSFYAGASQALDGVGDGYYWVNTHATSWSDNLVAYNAMAWYGLGTSDDPGSVSEWRTLDPYSTPCHNDWAACDYIGRYETVHISEGSYFHLMVGHKFPVYNAWSTFLIDDVSIVPADGHLVEDGYWFDGVVGWDPSAIR